METTVSWDLTGTGWQLCAVLVKADGAYDVYVPDPTVIDSGLLGSSDVTGITVGEKTYAPSHISFMGHHVPDGGATLMLLGLSFLGVTWVHRRTKPPGTRGHSAPIS